jgi:hypothetical protein
VAAPEPIVEVEPVAAAAPEPIVVVEPEPEPPAEPEEEPFDPATITKDVFDSTKVDVQRLINQLNGFIRSRNYEAWVGYLSRQYLSVISNPEFLARISESSRLKSQKIVLKDVRDYFIHVVVPSRANDRVDDIEFIGQKRVKAFTVTEKGQRLRLYDLEKTERGWQIMN